MFKKDFWKYFFNTYRKAGLLVVRYVLVALYLTVTSIIANKMELDNLTYFNSVIGLGLFGDLIGFGIAQGVGLLVNQHIKDREKASNYIKVGSCINVIISFLFVIILGVCYKPVLNDFLGLGLDINYTFYFIMLIYILLSSVLVYLVHILKELKMFKAEVWLAIIQGLLLIFGFLVTYFSFDLSLNVVGIVYVISSLIAIIFVCLYFRYNKTLSVSLISRINMKLDKKEMMVIFEMCLLQVIWQVGYSATSYFILRVSDVYFNQYSYLENVLDIFNGLFFAFVAVTSIDICRRLGEGDFEKSYLEGKRSLKATLVIWFIYLVLSVILSPFIIEGMNENIRINVYIVLLLYVVMYLFRFLSWNLISYILCWGGEMRILVWQEVVSSAYLVILYILGNIIPNNIYLIYGLITLPSIGQTILGMIIFRRKKWMKKISE